VSVEGLGLRLRAGIRCRSRRLPLKDRALIRRDQGTGGGQRGIARVAWQAASRSWGTGRYQGDSGAGLALRAAAVWNWRSGCYGAQDGKVRTRGPNWKYSDAKKKKLSGADLPRVPNTDARPDQRRQRGGRRPQAPTTVLGDIGHSGCAFRARRFTGGPGSRKAFPCSTSSAWAGWRNYDHERTATGLVKRTPHGRTYGSVPPVCDMSDPIATISSFSAARTGWARQREISPIRSTFGRKAPITDRR